MKDDPRLPDALHSLEESLGYLNSILSEKNYLVGRSMTLADLSVSVALICPFYIIYQETFSS